jgi:plastocyanin
MSIFPEDVLRTCFFLIVAAALGCGAASDSTPPQSPQPVASVVLTSQVPDSLFSIPDSVTVSAEARAASGLVVSDAAISWTSSDATVASVSPASGPSTTIVAVRAGSATITARSGTLIATKPIVVSQRAAALTVSSASADTLFSIGDTQVLSATARDSRGTTIDGAVVQWSLDKATVAAISPTSGATTTVTAVGSGAAVLTARSGALTATSSIAVRQRVKRVVAAPATVSVAVGGTTQLSATPLDARGNAVTGLPAVMYVSSDSTKARVSPAGVVTGVALGTATITVSVQTPDGVVTAAVAVTIGFPTLAEMKVEDFQFNPTIVEIAAGGQVRWTWAGSSFHSVTSTGSGPLRSPTQGSGTYTFTFPTPGRFDFFCTVHPFMTGSVIVH